MARKTPLERLQKRYGVSTKKTETSTKDKLQSQLDNYKTRFEYSGQDDPTDTRNALEKVLNLEKDQNVLFDIFEILDRPRNALFTAIDEAASGGNFLEGLGSGITGETKTSGKDLLLNHTNLEDEKGKLNWVDVLGTGLDMFADPLDYILLPAKGAGIAADVSKALSRVDTATDALNVARKTGNTSDIAKASKELYRAQTVANKAQDALKGVNKSLLYNNGKNFTTPMNIVGKGIGKAVKGGAKLADTGITKGLQASDNANATDLSRLYTTAKKDIASLVDSATNIKGFTRRSRDIDAAKDLDKVMGESRANILSKEIDDIVNTLGDGTTHDDISRKLVNAIQSEKNWDLTGQDIIDRFVEGKGKALIPSQAQANEILKVLDQFGIKAKVINEDLGDIDDILKEINEDFVKKGLKEITKDELIEDLGAEIIIDNKNLKDLFMVRDALFDPTTKMVTNDLGAEQLSSFKDLVFGSKNSARINDQLLADRKFFNKNPQLQKLYNE